jgi:hypothetical protein|tara:strand:+ start:1035 stop:1208 length:174 start_codon:yes stop_codon:yes gene_type:complete
MYVRNKEGKIVCIKRDKYSNDRDFYIDLWRIKYGIKIAKQNDINNLIDYVNGEKNFV